MNIHDFNIENFPMDHRYEQPFWKWRWKVTYLGVYPIYAEAMILVKIDQYLIHSYTSVYMEYLNETSQICWPSKVTYCDLGRHITVCLSSVAI